MMRMRAKGLTAAIAGLLWVAASMATMGAEGASQQSPTLEEAHAAYEAVLARYDKGGRVNYAALSADSSRLDLFLDWAARLSPEAVASWPETDQIAFWINAYNAITLKVIVTHYPIKARFMASWTYPKNSIRQIPGVWDRLTFQVAGEAVTLDHIENDILRKRFHEPRIHFALVCASVGCPELRSEPYRGSTLNAQLDDQVSRFVGDPSKFRIDPGSGRVYLSPIFKWFSSDFEVSAPSVGEGARLKNPGLSFLRRYLDAPTRAFLERGAYSVTYLDYDWSLNETSPP